MKSRVRFKRACEDGVNESRASSLKVFTGYSA
jgi:hypothetical protein